MVSKSHRFCTGARRTSDSGWQAERAKLTGKRVSLDFPFQGEVRSSLANIMGEIPMKYFSSGATLEHCPMYKQSHGWQSQQFTSGAAPERWPMCTSSSCHQPFSVREQRLDTQDLFLSSRQGQTVHEVCWGSTRTKSPVTVRSSCFFQGSGRRERVRSEDKCGRGNTSPSNTYLPQVTRGNTSPRRPALCSSCRKHPAAKCSQHHAAGAGWSCTRVTSTCTTPER